jgi:hypothetical protein
MTANIIIVMILISLIGLAARHIYLNTINGVPSCGCDCSSCSVGCSGHKNPKVSEKDVQDAGKWMESFQARQKDS